MSTEKEENKVVAENAQDHQCPNCTGKLVFVPTIGKWKCNYCKSEFDLKDLEIGKHNAGSNENNEEELIEDDDTTYVEYTCPDCGAKIVADEQTAATFCVYCGNTAILKNKLTGKFQPDYIIPFKIEADQAKEKFKNISNGRKFCPNDFNSEKNIEKIRGVYIPFWLYTLRLKSDLTMDGVVTTTWSDFNYRYIKKDDYNVEREMTFKYDRIPVDASTRFDNSLMNSIEPFDYKGLVPYNHAYLSGFLAERYDDEKEKVFEEIKKRALESSNAKMSESIMKYDRTKNKKTNNEIQIDKVEYVLLPVYMVNVKYNDKMYIFAMNGQTGEFIGDIPLDYGKIRKYRIILFAILFAISIAVYITLFLLSGGVL